MNNRFLHFDKKETLDKALNEIRDDSLTFCNETREIIHHKEVFGVPTWGTLGTEFDANGYEYVDLGLPSGTLWATCNIGADNPEDTGLYFAWAETKGYRTPSGKPGNFVPSTCPYWISGSGMSATKWSKYVLYSHFGEVDGKTTLEPEDDAAHMIMGGDWRMPTQKDFEELINNCNVIAGFAGMGSYKSKVTLESKINSKTLILPARGNFTGGSSESDLSYGYYWSSTLSDADGGYARYLTFRSSENKATVSGYYRYYGQLIRPVLSK